MIDGSNALRLGKVKQVARCVQVLMLRNREVKNLIRVVMGHY
jgi:hypothetical protein